MGIDDMISKRSKRRFKIDEISMFLIHGEGNHGIQLAELTSIVNGCLRFSVSDRSIAQVLRQRLDNGEITKKIIKKRVVYYSSNTKSGNSLDHGLET